MNPQGQLHRGKGRNDCRISDVIETLGGGVAIPKLGKGEGSNNTYPQKFESSKSQVAHI